MGASLLAVAKSIYYADNDWIEFDKLKSQGSSRKIEKKKKRPKISAKSREQWNR